MKTLIRRTLAIGLLTIAASSASAGTLTFNINGVFDTAGNVPNNTLANLNGTNYSASFTIGTNESSTQRSETDGNTRGWVFNRGYSGSLAVSGYSASSTEVMVAEITNNFYYDGNGADGLTFQGLAAGTYDIISINTWLKDPQPGGSILGDPIGGVPGFNFNQAVTFIASSDLFNSLDFPFGNLDLSKILYGVYGLETYEDGVLVGRIAQDPPVTFINGELTGTNFSVGVTTVPEPATTALLLTGVGLMGALSRRRKSKQS